MDHLRKIWSPARSTGPQAPFLPTALESAWPSEFEKHSFTQDVAGVCFLGAVLDVKAA